MKFALFALLVTVVTLSSPAQAQIAGQAYVSPGGTGTACSGSAPCNFFQVFNNTDSTQVSCIDGAFAVGVFLLTKPVTIDCPGGVFTTGNGTAALEINGPTAIFIIRGLTFNGSGQTGAPFILVDGAATVIIENCTFQDIGNHSAIAVAFKPSNVAAQLIIRDSLFVGNGIAPGTGGGLQVAPTGSGSASVKLERVSFEYNVTSMVLSGPVNATMINSTVQASRNTGIIVGSGSTLDIEDSKLIYNVGSAVNVSSGGTLRLSNNDIKNNQIGVGNSGGHAFTYSNNAILGNGSTASLTPIQRNQ